MEPSPRPWTRQLDDRFLQEEREIIQMRNMLIHVPNISSLQDGIEQHTVAAKWHNKLSMVPQVRK